MLFSGHIFFSALAAASGAVLNPGKCVEGSLVSIGESTGIVVGVLNPDSLVAGPSLIPGPLCVPGAPSSQASISQASISQASISQASISPASISPASISPANISPANISQASISQASISSALSSGAIVPGSTVPLIITNTSSASSSTVSTVVPTTVPEPFLLRIQVNSPQLPLRRKRQESSVLYLENAFSSSPSCEDGAQFRLVNGQLLKSGLVISVSDPPTPRPLLLLASMAEGISTTFYFTDRMLSWSNPRFPRQTAFFCLSANTVFVYFGTAPADCVDVTLLFTPLSECPGRQSLSTTASSISPSISGSQLSSAPISSTRPSSSTEVSSGSPPNETSTSKLSSPAVGTSTETSTQDINATTGESLVITTTPSQTTLGTSTQLPSFETSLYTSSRYEFPPESTSGFSSTVDVSSSQSSASSITQSTQEPPSSGSATDASSSQSSSSLSVQPTQSETSTLDTTSLSTTSSPGSTSETSSTETSSSLLDSSTSDASSSRSSTGVTSTTSNSESTSSEEPTSTSSEGSTSSSTEFTSSEAPTSTSSSTTSEEPTSTSSSSTASEPSCTSNTAGTFPASIGAATLFAPPTSPENNVQFGFNTDTCGSLGYTRLPTGDEIAFYTTNTPASVQACSVVGYLYHKRSGLCATAIAPDTPTTAKYTAANVQLQPCDITGPNPPEAQLFCGLKFSFSGCLVGLNFQGERTSGGPYTSSTDNNALESLVYPYGSFWTYNC